MIGHNSRHQYNTKQAIQQTIITAQMLSIGGAKSVIISTVSQKFHIRFDALQMMDLRWGIREQSRNDHTIIEFCLREIDKCRTKSIGPNFVVSGVRLCVFLYYMYRDIASMQTNENFATYCDISFFV